MILRKPAFVPTMISGCKAWLDSNAGLYCNVARNFEGHKNQYLTYQAYTGLQDAKYYSVQAWFKPNSISLNQTIVSLANSGASNDICFNMFLNNNTASFKTEQSVASAATASHATSIVNNSWNHLLAVRSNQDIRIYLNNNSSIVPVPLDTLTNNPGSTTLNLGALTSNTVNRTNFASGIVDSVAIWDRALSASEVNGLYNAGKGLDFNSGVQHFYSGMLNFWSLGERSGTAIDRTNRINLSQFNNPIGGSGKIVKLPYPNSAITYWQDKSAWNNSGIVLDIPKAPDYNFSSGNGFREIVFDNSCLSLNSLTGIFANSNRSYSIFGVYQPRNTNGRQALFSAGGNNGDNITIYNSSAGKVSGSYIDVGTSNKSIEGNGVSATPQLIYHSISPNGVAKQQLNHYSHTSKDCSTNTLNLNNFSVGAMITGTSPEYFSSASFNEILVYDSDLPQVQKNQIIYYLSHKWDLVPQMIPDIYCWYDCQRTNTLDLQDNKISTWKDISPNLRHVTGVIIPEYPTYSPSSYYNNKPTVIFNGQWSGNTMVCNEPVQSPIVATSFLIITKYEQNDNFSVSTRNVFSCNFPSTPRGPLYCYVFGSGSISMGAGRIYGSNPSPNVSIENYIPILVRGGVNKSSYGFTTSYSTSNIGRNLVTNYTTGAAVTLASQPNGFSIGGQPNDGIGDNISTKFRGEIQEIVLFSRLLNDYEIYKVENYMSAKWGVGRYY